MAEIESGIPAGVPPGRVRIATLSDGVYTEADRLEALSAVLADPDAFCWIVSTSISPRCCDPL